MQRPAVSGPPVLSRILLVGQAPGVKEPLLGRPFAWTAGRTLFRWFRDATGWQPQRSLDQTLDDILADWRIRIRSPR